MISPIVNVAECASVLRQAVFSPFFTGRCRRMRGNSYLQT